ncbi:hypothetical protein MMC15_001048 [Xylographa vitiligo]|nr:hypothetical protein [Xylographa vitiligo]
MASVDAPKIGLDQNISSLEGRISSISQTVASSSSKRLPLPSRSTTNAALNQSKKQDSVEAGSEKLARSAAPNRVVVEPSLWVLAYDALQKSNPELAKKFNYCLGLTTTDTDHKIPVLPSIDGVVEKAFKELNETGGSNEKLNKTSTTIRKYFEQTIKIVIASKDYISSAVSANPYAALAWAGVSLLLPLLLSPTEENEAAIEGLDYITNLMTVYEWKEKIYLRDGDTVSEFKDQATRIYTMILEYAATLLVHKYQNSPRRWARDVFQAGDWSLRINTIRKCDKDCRDVTDAITAVRARQWQNEERRWYEKLLQQPRQDEERRHIRTLYSNYNADKNIIPQRIVGTCEWFLNHNSFLTWRVSQNSTLLWLSADPGCGKSVLAKYLVDRRGEVLTVNTEPPTLCYFFFKDGDINRVDASKAICAFLHQLIMQQPHLYLSAKEDFQNKSQLFLTDFDALWNIFLKATTNASGKEIICVLDALDECHELPRKALINELVRLYSNLGSNDRRKPILKFVVTSRPIFNIVRDFKDLTSTTSEVRLRGEEESEHISHEIDLVIDYKVKQLGSKMDLSDSQQSSLRDKLKSIPHRTYLWLYLTLDTIEKKLELTKNDIAAITKTIPKNVDEAYTTILNKSPDKARARRLLHIVLAAIRPMTLEEANVAMVIEENQMSYSDLDIWRPDVSEDRIKNMCGLFLSVVDSKVYLIHQTAREFLVCDNYSSSSFAQQNFSPTCWKESFYPEQSNLLLAEICIWYLQLEDFGREELASTEEENEEEETEEDERDQIKRREEEIKKHHKWDQDNYTFLSYTAQYWAAHFTKAKNLPKSTLIQTAADKVCNTLSQSFRIWFDLYHEANRYQVPVLPMANILVGAHFGHDAIVRLLLDREDVDANSRDRFGLTALSVAAREGHEATISLLLKQKDIQVNSKDDEGRTPLLWAAIKGHATVVSLLLKRENIQIDSEDNVGRTPLSWAAIKGHATVVSLLLKRENIQIDSKDNKGRTPLSWAAGEGHATIVSLLLKQEDIQIDSKDNEGYTPLSWAAEEGHETVVSLLLKQEDIQIDSKDNEGYTPLSWAATKGYAATVRLLLRQKNIQVNVRDNKGRTPLWWAVYHLHETVIELLLQQEDVHADLKDDDGRTPLWFVKGGQADLDDDEIRRLWFPEKVKRVAVVKLLERHLHKTDHPHPPP